MQHAFYGWLGHCVLGWTEFNIRRAIGEVSVGKDIIENAMIPCIRYLSQNEKNIIDHLSKS